MGLLFASERRPEISGEWVRRLLECPLEEEGHSRQTLDHKRARARREGPWKEEAQPGGWRGPPLALSEPVCPVALETGPLPLAPGHRVAAVSGPGGNVDGEGTVLRSPQVPRP